MRTVDKTGSMTDEELKVFLGDTIDNCCRCHQGLTASCNDMCRNVSTWLQKEAGES